MTSRVEVNRTVIFFQTFVEHYKTVYSCTSNSSKTKIVRFYNFLSPYALL